MNNELKHYGVPGMRWGVRNARKTSNNRSAKNIKAGKKAVGIALGVLGTAAVGAVAYKALQLAASLDAMKRVW